MGRRRSRHAGGQLENEQASASSVGLGVSAVFCSYPSATAIPSPSCMRVCIWCVPLIAAMLKQARSDTKDRLLMQWFLYLSSCAIP